MTTCLANQSSSPLSMSNLMYPRKLLRAMTYDSLLPVVTSRKRLLSEQNQCNLSMTQLSTDDNETNKRFKIETSDHESIVSSHHHVLANISYTSFEKLPSCQSISLKKSTTIKNSESSPQSSTDRMLLCPQSPSIDNNNDNNKTHHPMNNENEQEMPSNKIFFVTSGQLSAYMTSNENLLIIDCGSPLRHNEKRIKESLLLNINDKISRKRLINRGLKNFLDQNQLNRLNQSNLIILYDDTIQSTTCSNPIQISSILQCIFDQIKLYDSTKIIGILQTSFEDFFQLYPIHCHISSSNLSIQSTDKITPSPTLDIDSYQMSEILPGLFLGNANDAQDLNLLKQNQIKIIINISTTIPCYYQNECQFQYLQLNCLDSNRENLLQYFSSTFEYIHTKLLSNENILVHCQGGISRSPSFIIGYLMKYYSKTFDQAYALVKDKRKIINPNLNFLAQLTRYEQMLTKMSIVI